ncbi:MAG TPA: hypothetical protein VM901_12235 [Bdellovibrionota bacterium]|jgi:hypothetical protein|nr:hypothetical protein [Bdellovibrionota bacterium]
MKASMALLNALLLTPPFAMAQPHPVEQVYIDSGEDEVNEEPKPVKMDLKNALVLTDNSGLKWYQLNLDLMTQEEAIAACKRYGLSLPTLKQVEDASKKITELAPKEKRLHRSPWTSTPSPHSKLRAMVFVVAPNGVITYANAGIDNDGDVLCVGK